MIDGVQLKPRRKEDEVKKVKKILREPEVLERVGISRSTLYRWIKSGDFPEPVQLGPPGSRAKGWIEEEIEEWLRSRPKCNGFP